MGISFGTGPAPGLPDVPEREPGIPPGRPSEAAGGMLGIPVVAVGMPAEADLPSEPALSCPSAALPADDSPASGMGSVPAVAFARERITERSAMISPSSPPSAASSSPSVPPDAPPPASSSSVVPPVSDDDPPGAVSAPPAAVSSGPPGTPGISLLVSQPSSPPPPRCVGGGGKRESSG